MSGTELGAVNGQEARLKSYLEHIGDVFGGDHRRALFATYAIGFLSDGERKSMEPIAARACADPDKTDALHQRIHHLLTDSPWSDREVRRESSRHALETMHEREPIVAWMVDDTGFLKQGSHSGAVQRQYTGSAGKITNCQIGVSLSLASDNQQLPVDFELYLPCCWTDDPARRKEAKIPDDVAFRTKEDVTQ